MDTWDAIRARRNVRSYTSQPIGQADLDRILEAGRRAPSARHGPPWDFVVVTGEGLRYDLGQATMIMMIAAADLGIGSGHASVGDQDLARRLLGFPEDRFLAYLIALGYPAGRPLAPIAQLDRRPFQDVVHYGRW